MPDWLTSLSALAEKATPQDIVNQNTDAEYLAACSPERVRALCELAREAEHARELLGSALFALFTLGELDQSDVESANLVLGAALASLEPAHKEET